MRKSLVFTLLYLFVTAFALAQTSSDSSAGPVLRRRPVNKIGGEQSPQPELPPQQVEQNRKNQAQPRRPSPVLEPTGTGERLQEEALTPEEKEEQKSDFQRFVEHSVGHELPMFGYDLFKGSPSTFAPLDQVPVPNDYVIGPGDELQIKGWGQLDLDVDTTVDRDGSIFLPKVGRIGVSGVRYSDLRNHLNNAISRVFHNFDLSVSLGQLRSIQVFVVGQVMHPGTYTISSLSTLVNALFASGGPNKMGSMRRIRLMRGNKQVTEFDFYQLLTQGDKSNDAHLLSGDVIYVPPVGPLVAVAEGVKVPAIYELKGESTLGELIQLAGGLSTTAEHQEVLLERIADHKNRTVQRLKLDASTDTKLSDGDIVTMFSISPRFDNAVTLRGNVARPGRYQWADGMRIRDLIPNRETLISPDYWRKINVSTSKISENGISSDVRAEAVDINWDYALIERLDLQKVTTVLIPFNLGNAINDPNSEDNMLLRPGDVVTVFSHSDFHVPVAKRTKFVTLQGEFKAAGVYRVEGETLPDLVARAGGLTQQAYLEAAEFTRESVRLSQQKALKDFIQSLETDLQRSASQQANAAQGQADQLVDAARVESQERLLQNLRRLKPTGRVILQLRRNADGSFELPPIPLEDGDSFSVPARPLTVGVVGMVYNSGDFVYEPNQTVHQYLRLAGGATPSADTDNIYVLRADGSVLTGKGSSLWGGNRLDRAKLRPGDSIIVPEQLRPGQFTKNFKDWAGILSQFGLGAAALKVLMQ